MKYFLKVIAILCLTTHLFAQSKVLHIEGQVNISIKKGTFKCLLEVSNLPLNGAYGIAINKGMQLTDFSDPATQLQYQTYRDSNDNVSGEAYIYMMKEKVGTSKLNKIKIHYNGKYKVVDDQAKAERRGDWKGNIAFNGQSIRASEQSAWYPILYDANNSTLNNKVTYDITIHCVDCSTIYINGSLPYKGSSNKFASTSPLALMLYAGVADFTIKDKVNFINCGLKEEQLNTLNAWTKKIIDYFEAKLNKPYGNDITFIYTTPVTKENAWMFFTYPSITIIGHDKYNVKSYFKNDTILRDSSLIQYLSHEMGHYYFGNVFVPNGKLRWAFLEGVTEYMSLLITKQIIGEAAYKSTLKNYLEQIADYKPKPLSSITNDEIDETYRYVYFPLLLCTLEKKVGQEVMWNWLKILVNEPKNVENDFSFFKSTLLKSGVSENNFKNFEFICINAENAKENVVKLINKSL